MARFKAACIHLAICALVGAVLSAMLWYVWYPAPLLQAVGGTHIFLMLLVIDVILGPLLTFVVFKPGKRSLRFDLVCIAVVQLLALTYGLVALFEGRPVYVVSLGHRFDLVLASEVSDAELATAGKTLSWRGPEWVGVKISADAKERERIMFSALGGSDYGHFPQHHQPLAAMRDELLSKSKSTLELKILNAGKSLEIDEWMATRGASSYTTRFQGLKAKGQDMAVIMDAKTAKVIGIAPFKPWD